MNLQEKHQGPRTGVRGVTFQLRRFLKHSADPYCFPSLRDGGEHRLLLQDADRRHDGGVHHKRTHGAERSAGAQVRLHVSMQESPRLSRLCGWM